MQNGVIKSIKFLHVLHRLLDFYFILLDLCAPSVTNSRFPTSYLPNSSQKSNFIQVKFSEVRYFILPNKYLKEYRMNIESSMSFIFKSLNDHFSSTRHTKCQFNVEHLKVNVHLRNLQVPARMLSEGDKETHQLEKKNPEIHTGSKSSMVQVL